MNSDSAAPPAIPDDPSPAAAPTVLPLKEMGKPPKEWSLTLHPTHLALAESPADRPYVILREQLMKKATLMEGMNAFVVEQPRKVMFQLTPAGTKALADWIGKPLLASFYMHRRFTWCLPWAILWIIGSLLMLVPVPGGAAAPRFDWVGLLLGLVLVGAWAFARWRPHPVLFLVDFTWFSWVAVRLTLGIIRGQSKGWLVVVLLLAWSAVTGLRHFLRFRETRLEPWRK